MLGNRVRVVLQAESGSHPRTEVTGVLHKLDPSGVSIYREHQLPEGRGMSFIPMYRVVEVIDLGRAP